MNLNLYLGDTFRILKAKQDAWKHKFRTVFVDPSYFMSVGLKKYEKPQGTFKEKGIRLYKGDWDNDITSTDDIYIWNYQWLKLVKPLITEDGTIWVCGLWNFNLWTVRKAMEKLGYSHLNDISIIKPNAPPNLKGARFGVAHECMIWAKPNKHRYFAYKRMKQYDGRPDSPPGKQMRDTWVIPINRSEKVGRHPTQKAFEQIRRCILASTDKSDWVLDPFAGTGTTMRLCRELDRNCACIEKGFYYPDPTTNKYPCSCGKQFHTIEKLIRHNDHTDHERQFMVDIEKKVGWGQMSIDNETIFRKITKYC